MDLLANGCCSLIVLLLTLPLFSADWRIVVAAPLRLTNQLPVPGSLLVWEQQAGSKDLVGRQTVQVPTGATVPIHTGVWPTGGRSNVPHCTGGELVVISMVMMLSHPISDRTHAHLPASRS